MPSAVTLRTDFSASELRRQAKRSKDNNQSRRLLSLAAVLDGMNRTDAARIGGMDRQTLRDWVHRFNEAGPEGLLDNRASGPAPRLSPDQKAELAAIVEAGPDREVDGVVRWRRVDLAKAGHRRALRRRLSCAACGHVAEEDRFLAYQRAAASSSAGCPDHRGFQKNFSRALSVHLAEVPEGTPIEIWLQDEARIGQKNGVGNGPGAGRGRDSPPTSATKML